MFTEDKADQKYSSFLPGLGWLGPQEVVINLNTSPSKQILKLCKKRK